MFDRFDVVKLLNEKLTQPQRETYREVTDKLDKDAMKGIRWLLLMNCKKPDDLACLQETRALNVPLAKAYYPREELRQLWNQPDWRSTQRFVTP